MAEDKKMDKKDEKRLIAACAVSLLLVVFLCVFSFLAAEGHAGLPSYDEAGLEELVMLLDSERWAVDAAMRASLEKHFGINGATELRTMRSADGLDMIIHTSRSPYVLSVKKGKERLEGVFNGRAYSAFLLYESSAPVFCLHLRQSGELMEFPEK